jgi:hypothetical protein
MAELYWTWELIDKTRKEIYRFLCASETRGSKIYFKRKKQDELEYDSIDDMIVDGWALN